MTEKLFLLCAQHTGIDQDDIVSRQLPVSQTPLRNLRVQKMLQWLKLNLAI